MRRSHGDAAEVRARCSNCHEQGITQGSLTKGPPCLFKADSEPAAPRTALIGSPQHHARHRLVHGGSEGHSRDKETLTTNLKEQTGTLASYNAAWFLILIILLDAILVLLQICSSLLITKNTHNISCRNTAVKYDSKNGSKFFNSHSYSEAHWSMALAEGPKVKKMQQQYLQDLPLGY